MTSQDIRNAALWAIKHGLDGYTHTRLRLAARAVDNGELVVPGEVGAKHPYTDVVLALYDVGVDVTGLKESRGT